VDFGDVRVIMVGPRLSAGVDQWTVELQEPSGSSPTTPLEPVGSYAEAAARLAETSADRIFVSAEVMAEMVAAGVGP
jgi:hypothetical protein